MLRHLLRLFAALLLWSSMPALGQSVIERLITPGDLSNAHAKLEANCASCHESFSKGAQNSKCLSCHKPIGADAARQAGFHGRYAPARSGACKTCHTEHKGRAFDVARFDTARFNHALTDYPLTGGHAQATCAGCHGQAGRYRGTPTNCADCHAKEDPHKGQLGRDCQSCHAVAGWKQVKPFDHGKTGFALTGAHSGAACLSCHSGQKWKELPATCNSCHARDDVHKGTRGTNCAQCHGTVAWKTLRFDHDTTGFPLLGAHDAASCASCHGANNSIKRPSKACSDCHARDDAHKGRNGQACQDCHNSRNWKQVSFDHERLTQFPLRGAHRTPTCNACHVEPARAVKLATECASCHTKDDVHKGTNGGDCARCHGDKDWKIVNFDHDRMTKFPLTGAHGTTKCETCHVQPADKVKLATDCVSCHRKDDAHSGKLGNACQDCHGTADWKTNVRFDHGLTRFPLLGKHTDVQCSTCHLDKSFAAKGVACADCHADDHHKGTLGKPSACASCHNSIDWKAWSFDHDKATSFQLTGAHRGLICSGCHIRAGDPAKVSTDCVSCHRRDDKHRGGFGTDCARCHTTNRFSEVHM